MIQDVEVAREQGAPATAAEEPIRAEAEFDRHLGLRCQDQSRFRSPAVTRAFTSVIRTSSLGSQSEVSQPDEVMLLDPDAGTPTMGIGRGVD